MVLRVNHSSVITVRSFDAEFIQPVNECFHFPVWIVAVPMLGQSPYRGGYTDKLQKFRYKESSFMGT